MESQYLVFWVWILLESPLHQLPLTLCFTIAEDQNSYEKSCWHSFFPPFFLFFLLLDIPLIVRLVNYCVDYLSKLEEFLDSLKTATFY